MVAYDFQTIKTLLEKSIKDGVEAELTLYLNQREYMIIIYKDHCSFQRCGYKDGSGEWNFQSLEELYRAEQIDHIVLERDWEKIEDIECFDFDVLNLW